jgi:uncharacterized protein (DUF924 family)
MHDMAVNFRKNLEEHTEVLRQFGRYPHRNKALGRTSTPPEEAFLAEGGSRWGQ